MFLFRRIEAYKKENRRAISLQGIDSCPVSISHDGVMLTGHESMPCKHITRRCYESHLAVL